MFRLRPNLIIYHQAHSETQKVALCLSRSVTNHPVQYQSGLPSVQDEERQANTK